MCWNEQTGNSNKKRERERGREGEKRMNRRRTGVRETDARGGRLQGEQ